MLLRFEGGKDKVNRKIVNAAFVVTMALAATTYVSAFLPNPFPHIPDLWFEMHIGNKTYDQLTCNQKQIL